MTDITSSLMALTQQYKKSVHAAYKNRFEVSEIPTSESHFLRESSELHLQLLETRRVLTSVQQLTRETSLFNNQSGRMQSLCTQVENSLKTMQIRLSELGAGGLTSECPANILEILQQRLLALSRDFKQVLESRSKILKATENKRSSLATSADVTISSIDVPTFMEEQPAQETMEYLETRCQSSEVIEKQMHEISGMISRMAHIVHEQQAMIERIDQNTNESLLNLEKGKLEVEKYYKNVSSNRNLGIKVFMIFVLFFVFWVVFLI